MTTNPKLIPGDDVDELNDFYDNLKSKKNIYCWDIDFDEQAVNKRTLNVFDMNIANRIHQKILRAADVHRSMIKVVLTIPIQKYDKKTQKKLRPVFAFCLKCLSLFSTGNRNNQGGLESEFIAYKREIVVILLSNTNSFYRTYVWVYATICRALKP